MLVAQYDMFSAMANAPNISPRVCFIQTMGGMGQHGRKDADNSASVGSFGALAVRNEIPYPYSIVPITQIRKYDFALLSLTSVVEIMNILLDVRKYGLDKGKCKIIAGGMGCLNIWPLRDIIDVAVFGRAEGQIADIIDGATPSNVWRKELDYDLGGRYIIRQARGLLPGERGIGCPNKCLYCQYTHVRQYLNLGTGYRAAAVDSVYEDDWNRLQFKSGRNITAWDGLSQETRYRVHKAVSDKAIYDKLVALREYSLRRTSNIKIFNIVGYPWETPETYNRDMDSVRELLRSADGKTGTRILIMMMHTPFSPEPYTPMEGECVNFTDWRDIANIRGRQIFKGDKIEAFVLPQIAKPHTLQRRIAMNYANRLNYNQVIKFILSAKEPIDDFYNTLSVTGEGLPSLTLGKEDYEVVPDCGSGKTHNAIRTGAIE